MEEQQTTQEQHVDSRIPAKPNRHHRRAMYALEKKQRSKAEAANRRRLKNFNALTTWKDEATAKGKLSTEQVDAVFKTALNRIFKRDIEEAKFHSQLKAITRNVIDGKKLATDSINEKTAVTNT